MKDNDIRYIVEEHEFVDMRFLLEMFDNSKSHLHRMMNDFGITKRLYKNQFLYRKDEVIELWKQEQLKTLVNGYFNKKTSMKEVIDMLMEENDSCQISEKIIE